MVASEEAAKKQNNASLCQVMLDLFHIKELVLIFYCNLEIVGSFL